MVHLLRRNPARFPCNIHIYLQLLLLPLEQEEGEEREQQQNIATKCKQRIYT